MPPRDAGNQRPLVIKKIKKASDSHHGGAWKIAYADFVTAMMAFFMLLWMLAIPDEEQLKALADYFAPISSVSAGETAAEAPAVMSGTAGQPRKEAVEASTASGEPVIEAAAGTGAANGGTAIIPSAAMRVLASELRITLEPPLQEAGDRSVSVEEEPEGLRITLMDSARRSMFRTGSAELNRFALEKLTEISEKLRASGALIAIEGHTDSSGGQNEKNLRLSGERALAARGAMANAGIPEDRFVSLIAKGGSEPVYPAEPERPENRRISIVLLTDEPALPQDLSFTF